MKERKAPLTKHKDIARIDQELKKTHGWYVRIRFNGKVHCKLFSDKKSGGKNSSLLAAIAWRDNTRDKIGKPRTDRRIVSKSRNNTGIVGVRLDKKLNRYEISWVNPNGTQGKSSVSISKHGKAAALKLAIKKREEKNNQRLASS